MSPLTLYVGAGVLALLALIALRGKRWAYLAFVVLGLLYFPAQTHFRVHAPKCEQLLPTLQVLLLSLHNYAYIALLDRKSTRLNSSHLVISYAVFCLKKKNTTIAGPSGILSLL